MRHALLAAALTLPYTLTLSGEGPFYAKAGVDACVAASRDDLQRQRGILERACARDGGRLGEGAVVDTLVQGVYCTSVQPLTCERPGRAGSGGKSKRAPSGVADLEGPPRA
jgi:hypothetical protein